MQLGDFIIELSKLALMPKLYESACFDWGGSSSEHHLAANWKLDLQQHAEVYQQLAEPLGETHPMAKLIKNELAKDDDEPASKSSSASSAFTSFWKDTTKSFQTALADVVKYAEKLTEEHKQATEAALQYEDWYAADVAASTTEEASGRIDGSLRSLLSGEGNIPLNLKLELANKLGSFKP